MSQFANTQDGIQLYFVLPGVHVPAEMSWRLPLQPLTHSLAYMLELFQVPSSGNHLATHLPAQLDLILSITLGAYEGQLLVSLLCHAAGDVQLFCNLLEFVAS